MATTDEMEELLAAPSAIGIHSTLALSSTAVGNPAAANSNEPGLEKTNIFGTLSKGGNMGKHGWLFWILVAVIGFFAYKYFTTGSVSVSA